MTRIFSSVFSPSFKKSTLYSCALLGNDAAQVSPQCCRCDADCFLRGDCCFDVDFMKNPLPPAIYLEHMAAKKIEHYRNGTCLPAVRLTEQSNHIVQYVYAIDRCLNGEPCLTNYGQLVAASDGKMYRNKLCALCNNVTDSVYPEITFTGCNSNDLKDLKQIRNLTGCRISINSNKVLTCPFGSITRPTRYVELPKQHKCSKLEFEVCQAYFGVVQGSNGEYYSNPHCQKCLPYKDKAMAPQVQCENLQHNKDFFDIPKKNINENPSLNILLLQTGTKKFKQGQNNTIKSILCHGRNTVFDVETMSCVTTQYLNSFNKYPVPTATPNAVTSSPNDFTTLQGRDEDLLRFVATLYEIQHTIFPTLLMISIFCLVFTAVTYLVISGLQHTPGRLVVIISLIQLVYSLTQLSCHHGSYYTAIAVHWCILCKYLFILTLIHQLWKMSIFDEDSEYNQKVTTVLYTIGVSVVAFIFVMICVSKDHTMKYGQGMYCLSGSVEGRVYGYLLPMLLMFLLGVFVIMCINHRTKYWDRELQQTDMAVLLSNALNLSLYLICAVFAIDMLGTVYTEKYDEVYQLVDSLVSFVFCVLNGLQGLVMLVIFVGKKYILMTYCKKISDGIAFMKYALCCCDCCPDNDDDGNHHSNNDTDVELNRLMKRSSLQT